MLERWVSEMKNQKNLEAAAAGQKLLDEYGDIPLNRARIIKEREVLPSYGGVGRQEVVDFAQRAKNLFGNLPGKTEFRDLFHDDSYFDIEPEESFARWQKHLLTVCLGSLLRGGYQSLVEVRDDIELNLPFRSDSKSSPLNNPNGKIANFCRIAFASLDQD